MDHSAENSSERSAERSNWGIALTREGRMLVVYLAVILSAAYGRQAYEMVNAVAKKASSEVREMIAEWDARHLVAVGAAGFAAQLVDGSLGMGYGVTSSTVLVAAGLSPATASASVHLAQLGTTALSGVAHYRYGNVDEKTMWSLSLPGSVGAFIGAALLASLTGSAAKSVTAALLFVMGVRILVRGGRVHAARGEGRPALAFLFPLGLVGGFVDATGGGGWGPVVTSGLLADGRLQPKIAIGTVSNAFLNTTRCGSLEIRSSNHVETSASLRAP